MKIMLYCQHVLGIGHFFRSMEIAGALNRHEVLFVEGGSPLAAYTPPPHVRRFLLPPLMMDSEFKKMEAREGNVEEAKKERTTLLMDRFLEFEPDLFITELFPFGRKQFRFELLPILETVRRDGLQTKVICSLRDILVEKEDQAAYENGVLQALNTFYDHLLIHSDPRIVSLNETFQRVEDIRIPIHYTGFVARKPSARVAPDGRKIIVASSGGGKVGVDLLVSTVLAIGRIDDPQVRLRVFGGPFMESESRKQLQDLAGEDPRVSIHPFSMDFIGELSRAELSVSMAGYNTCMDIVSAGVKSLVYPFPQNREQFIRAGKLSDIGIMKILKDLNVETLMSAIRIALEESVRIPTLTPDVSGASNTALWVEKQFGSH